MKKKNLIILLVIPFLISVFCIITVNTTYNMVDVDISHIDWDYDDMEGFKLSADPESPALYPLRAEGVNQRNYAVSDGNALEWSVENKDALDPEPCAEIVVQGGNYYIRALKPGEIIITCSNAKGNVQRRLPAIIYETAVIMLYPTISASGANIDSTVYYGEYDHTVGNAAKISMTLNTMNTLPKNKIAIEHSENIRYDLETSTIEILGPGDAFIRASSKDGNATPVVYGFTVVDEGVNVYTYEDLLYCTNRSTGGHIAVLRKHFESLENTYVMNGNSLMLSGGIPVKKPGVNNVECFGYYDAKTKTFSFSDEIYSFETTYNKNFIEQWNKFAQENSEYKPITDKVYAGLHVQRDFYGNGYTLNLHNLTYPYAYSLMTNDSGNEVRIPTLTSANLYRGPLKLYSLGDPNNVPLVSLYGQDNIGMYVNGDGITVNDVNLKNCDFGDRMANLDTVGTVMEIRGDNITVKNSKISNGKNVLRSFSSMNFLLDNSLLSNARNFLFVTGANEYEPVDLNRKFSYTTPLGNTVTTTVGEYLEKDAEGDKIINSFLKTSFAPKERAGMKEALLAIQKSLEPIKDISTDYKGSTVVRDTYFYRSGISAICMEALFNSAFLETGKSPSMITDVFAMVQSEGKSLVPYTAQNISGVAYPVLLTVEEGVRFYDYKEVGKIELDGLIEENISEIASSLGVGGGAAVSIDQIFPLQSMIKTRASGVDSIYSSEGKSYYNIPIAYYGGGLNLSKVDIQVPESTVKIDVDLLDSYLNLSQSGSGQLADLKGLMLKTVVSVTGYEPFAFHFIKNGYLFGETPNVSELVNNAR